MLICIHIHIHTCPDMNCVGLMPANYLHCNTGLILSELSDDSLGPRLFWAALKLLVIGSLALVPTLFKKNLQEKAGLQDFNKKKD